MWFKRMKLSVCLVVCQSLSVELQQKSSGSTKEILSLVKCPMLELFSCAGFSEGHQAGNLRSPSARQAYKAIKIGLRCLAARQTASSLWNKWIWVFHLSMGKNPNARCGVAAGDRVGCS